MKRGEFIKSLFVLAFSPKILANINLNSSKIAIAGTYNRVLISDLQLLAPEYYKEYLELYGDENITWWLDNFGNTEK